MVTTQVVPDSESTCGTAVCVISLNTNLSNFPNRAGQNLQVGGNSICVSFNTNLSNLTNRAGWNLQVGVLKKHESNCSQLEVNPCAISKVRMIRVKINTAKPKVHTLPHNLEYPE